MKQYIVIRKDLRNRKGEKVRTGKLIGQASHGILNIFAREVREKGFCSDIEEYLCGDYKKIVLGISSEEELVALYDLLVKDGVVVEMVEDLGLTEFNGKTKTCFVTGIVKECSLLEGLSLY